MSLNKVLKLVKFRCSLNSGSWFEFISRLRDCRIQWDELTRGGLKRERRGHSDGWKPYEFKSAQVNIAGFSRIWNGNMSKEPIRRRPKKKTLKRLKNMDAFKNRKVKWSSGSMRK